MYPPNEHKPFHFLRVWRYEVQFFPGLLEQSNPWGIGVDRNPFVGMLNNYSELKLVYRYT
jgi:hypothetical protein